MKKGENRLKNTPFMGNLRLEEAGEIYILIRFASFAVHFRRVEKRNSFMTIQFRCGYLFLS